MFYTVDSRNRHAVRKALTSIGMNSAEVRNMRNGQLGKALHDAVAEGKITSDRALAACGSQGVAEPEPPEHHPDAAPTMRESEITAVPYGDRPDEAAIALGRLIASLAQRPAIDMATIQRMVQDAIAAEKITPAVVEIRCENLVTHLEGSAVHARFETLCRVINTRVDGRRLHAWLVGPSGSGKSFLQSQVAKACGLTYYSTGAIQSKYDLIGFVPPAYTGRLEDCPSLLTPFRRAFQFGGLFGWDDVDGSDPRAFVSFNEALSNGRLAFPDGMIEQHPDFVAIASANTWGQGATADYVGRNKVDAATLTRFVRIEVPYDEDMELALVGKDGEQWARYVQAVRRAVQKEGVKVLVTPRHTLQGAALLKAGLDRAVVERMTVFAGLDSSTEAKIRAAAGRS